jgi:ATP-binding cassette subfamily B protein
MVMAGEMTIGQIVAFNSYVLILSMPIQHLTWFVNSAGEAAAGATRVFEILDEEAEIKSKESAIKPGKVKGQVEFKNVSFTYKGEKQPSLLGIDFSVEPGQTIGIIGATGSGKTTLINMIPRFYDVDEGAVLIDGEDVRNYDLIELRRNIGLVLQTSLLFSSTIRENIAFGNPDASEEEIVKAAEAALAHEFIIKLPEGYDTVVGERGITLSGGQRQRVAIARALLVNPSILIMDDSTSSVDTETEHKIQQALDKLIANRTTIIIAQRLSSVRDADLILVMDEGQIKERGKHADLLKMNGLYKEIYDLQLTQQENFDEEIKSVNTSREEKNG